MGLNGASKRRESVGAQGGKGDRGEGPWTLQAAARRGEGAQYAHRCVDSIELDTQMRHAAMMKRKNSVCSRLMYCHDEASKNPVCRHVKNTEVVLESLLQQVKILSS